MNVILEEKISLERFKSFSIKQIGYAWNIRTYFNVSIEFIFNPRKFRAMIAFSSRQTFSFRWSTFLISVDLYARVMSVVK